MLGSRLGLQGLLSLFLSTCHMLLGFCLCSLGFLLHFLPFLLFLFLGLQGILSVLLSRCRFCLCTFLVSQCGLQLLLHLLPPSLTLSTTRFQSQALGFSVISHQRNCLIHVTCKLIFQSL